MNSRIDPIYFTNILLMQMTADSSKDGNIMLDDIFTTAVLNILWVIVASTRFQRGDPKMETLASCMNGFIRTSNGGPNLLSFFPFIRYIAPQSSGFNDLMRNIGPLRSYIEVTTYVYISTSKFY